MEEKKSVLATVKEKWNRLAERTKPGRDKFGAICGKTGHVLGTTGKWIYRLRSVFLSVPVVLAAVMLAIKNGTVFTEIVHCIRWKIQHQVQQGATDAGFRNLARFQQGDNFFIGLAHAFETAALNTVGQIRRDI